MTSAASLIPPLSTEAPVPTLQSQPATVRPVPAAALVLLRSKGSDSLEVLLGRRHAAAGFMPGIYVVPGGRVEPEDGQASGFAEDLRPLPPGLDKATHKRAASIARAAVRETFEETGLLYGECDDGMIDSSSVTPPGAAPIWTSYLQASVRPAFDQLSFIARAITPSFSHRRFHTRFLLGDGRFARGRIGGDGELEDIGWYSLHDTAALPMANITLLVLNEAVKHYKTLKNTGSEDINRSAAMFRWTGSRHNDGVSRRHGKLRA